jgi:type I restriction enzyme S subunit
MADWKEYKLKDAIEQFIDYRGKTPTKTESGIPLITAKIVKDGRILEPNEFIATENYKSWMTRGYPEINDVVLTTEAPLGEVALLKNKNVALAQRIITLRGEKGICDNVFLKYYLQSNAGQFALQARASGSTVEGIKASELREVEIYLPPFPEQQAIAEVLSSLDDKIDLLHRQNKTLEAIAETLFRQWFVEEAEESWEIKKVSEVCKVITKGTTPTSLGHHFTESGVNFIKAESLTDDGGLIENKFSYISEDTHNFLNRSKIEPNDLVLTIAGTIGRVAIVPERFLPANTNQAVAILRANDEVISHSFLYSLFKSGEIRNDFEGRVVHAVQPNLSLGEIGSITFRLPPTNKLAECEKHLENLFEKKESNNIQICSLTKLRDTLLPKLMSGDEVRVKLGE